MEKYSCSAISIADSTWRIFMGKLCVCVLRLSLSLQCFRVCPWVFYTAFILSNIYGRPRSPRGCWPAGYLSGPVRDTLFPVQRSSRPGWWRHKSPTTLFRGAREYRARWHGHVENTPFFIFCVVRHSQLTLFFEPLLLRETPLATFPPVSVLFIN